LADKSTIVVATNNPGKLKEFALLLPDFKIISQSLFKHFTRRGAW
jgi:inosine/xanthosine triphosphate pyrophosphatase family protein